MKVLCWDKDVYLLRRLFEGIDRIEEKDLCGRCREVRRSRYRQCEFESE